MLFLINSDITISKENQQNKDEVRRISKDLGRYKITSQHMFQEDCLVFLFILL